MTLKIGDRVINKNVLDAGIGYVVSNEKDGYIKVNYKNYDYGICNDPVSCLEIVTDKSGTARDEMSLRDYIAIKAMGAMITKHEAVIGYDVNTMDIIRKSISKGAYKYADAMLAERDK